MLIATQAKNVRATLTYFDEVLTKGDYYLGQEVGGKWRGKGAELLGLGHEPEVTREQFGYLLDGKHPTTGEKLTQRHRKDRRPGMDLTFSVPKSVSLAWAINDDERITQVLREAVHETMTRDVEPLMQRRVRDGRHANTKQKSSTGKLVYADFLHKTSRPVDGTPDPHLHIHAFVMNWTEQNGTHYAGELEEIVRQRPSLQAKFEARLAGKLKHLLGYGITHTRFVQSGRIKSGWELAGLDRKTIEKFSRRTQQVEEFAERHGITSASEKGKLGKKTREAKNKGATVDELRNEWRSRLTDRERSDFAKLGGRPLPRSKESEHDRAEASVRYAVDHHLHRESTVERHRVVATALEHGLTLSPESVEQALGSAAILERTLDDNGTERSVLTTREVLAAEKRMIEFARDGRGTRKPIGKGDHEFSREWLDDQQKAAVEFVLESRDTVLAVAGGAGTGKSSLMQEAAEAIQATGKRVHTFAPSTGAVDVLKGKGFENAQTVEHLIRNDRMHAGLKDQVLWIDEAGLLDVRSMNAVFDIAREQGARLVLSGDTRQHSSPGRGEAMRLLEDEAGLNVARMEAIKRQQGMYRSAVELVSKGHETVEPGKSGLLAGFDRLDEMGKIKEIGDGDRQACLAAQYVEALGEKKSTLVIAPTHAEARSVTEQIRETLRESGQLSRDQRNFTQLRSLNLSDAQKREASTYTDAPGLIVQFHQNVAGGFNKGDRYRVAGAVGNDIELVSADGISKRTLSLDSCNRFEVYSEAEVSLAVGDKIRFSLGGTSVNGESRIANGRLDEVASFDEVGNIVLKRGVIVDKNYGHLDLGYVITSHASQGKDRQVALAAMSSESLPAVNAKQFYVTVSRGSEDVAIFVDDKARMRQAIEKSGQQLSATELLRAGSETARSLEGGGRSEEQTRQVSQLVKLFRERVYQWLGVGVTASEANQEVGRHRRDANDRSLGREFGRSIGLGPA
ncbi:MAG: MobF family relaxase [Planctomycetota bacterium]